MVVQGKNCNALMSDILHPAPSYITSLAEPKPHSRATAPGFVFCSIFNNEFKSKLPKGVFGITSFVLYDFNKRKE